MPPGQHFKVLLCVKKRPHDVPIHFKVDGQRFACERTFKMNVNTKYAMEFTFKPPQTVDRVMVQGEAAPVSAKDRSGDSSLYRAEWATVDMTKCKKGGREQIPVAILIRDVGELKLIFQVKLYSEHEQQHTCWGPMVNHIEYECRTPDTGSLVDISKETVR